MPSDNVIQIRPKTLRRTYRKYSYVLTYIVDCKKWSWDVTHVATTHYGATADTMHAAMRAAEKHIDETIAIKGE